MRLNKPIRLSQTTRLKLKLRGRKGQTYDNIIKDLLALTKKKKV